MGGCTIGVMENGELRDLYKDWSRIKIVGIRWAFYLTSGHPSVGSAGGVRSHACQFWGRVIIAQL